LVEEAQTTLVVLEYIWMCLSDEDLSLVRRVWTSRSRSLGQILKSRSASESSIAFKFGRQAYKVSSRYRRYTTYVQGQKSTVKVTGSKVKVDL